MPLLHTNQRQRKEGKARHRFAHQAGKEAIESVGLFFRFADDRLIATQEVQVVGVMQSGTKEDPKQLIPGQHGGKETLDSAVAAAGSQPSRHALHGDPTGHRENSLTHPAQLPNDGQPQEWCQTEQGCNTIAHEFLLVCRWFGLNTPTTRQKPVLRDSSGGMTYMVTMEPYRCLVIKDPARLSFWLGYW